ncbi:MAG: hypothetical protein R3C19_10645 [Planctomycetaceae bacterium]
MSDTNLPSNVEQPSPREEHTFHHYRGNVIPWYVRLIWVGFWIGAVVYIIRYFFPAMQVELLLPP